jgi:hypothetical protein
MFVRYRRRLTFAAAALSFVTIGSLGLAGPSTANTTRLADQPHRIPGTGDCVRPLTLARVDALWPDGTMQAARTDDGLGRAYHFRAAEGEVSELVPPAGWRPQTASDKELATYGFPHRPSDPAALKRWNDRMAKWKRSGTPGMCVTNMINGGLTNVTHAPNWAGGMNVNGSATVPTFYQAMGEWVQPGFVDVCGGLSTSTYSIWAGLGGWNQLHRLMQAGVAASFTDLNHSFMWWEVLNSFYLGNAVEFSGEPVNPGDDVGAAVLYDAPEARMSVFDYTTGISNVVALTSWAGIPMSDFYDGTTADFITEAPSGGPAYGNYYLRKPASGYTYYSYAATNYAPIASYYSWRLNEVGPSGRSMQTSGFDGVHAWQDTWTGCS